MNTLILKNFEFEGRPVDVYYLENYSGCYIQFQKGDKKRECFAVPIKNHYERFNTTDLRVVVMALLAEGNLESEPLDLTVTKDTFETWCILQAAEVKPFDINAEVVQLLPLNLTEEFRGEKDCDVPLRSLKRGFDLTVIDGDDTTSSTT